jgi:polyisoprenyl-phosphate glycosyltransferase
LHNEVKHEKELKIYYLMNKPKIAVVVPVYGCKTQLAELYIRLKAVLGNISEDFEIILVNDNCPYMSWETIIELCKKDIRVKGINLSRNFGQHYAITAGLEHSKSEWVVVMDCDLQDQPEEIVSLYNKALEGFDIVLARRNQRKDGFLKKITSKLFYKTLSYLTSTEQDSAIGNFGIYHRKVIDAVCSMGDSMKYFPTMVRWVGFKHTAIDIEHEARLSGKSAYSFMKLLRLSLDVILSFSDKPLRLIVKLGMFISGISIVSAVYFLIKYILGYIHVLGWTSLIISIWFLSGIIIFLIGMLGLYISKTFENSKNRPKYIVKDYINFDE